MGTQKINLKKYDLLDNFNLQISITPPVISDDICENKSTIFNNHNLRNNEVNRTNRNIVEMTSTDENLETSIIISSPINYDSNKSQNSMKRNITIQ